MSDTLSTLINSGISLVEALERCINASNNSVISWLLVTISLVTQGQELSYALGLIKLFQLLVSMIKIGEETGALSFMLENLANFYKES